MDSKTAQKLANELQGRAAYSGKGSAKTETARAAQRLADRIRKAGKCSEHLLTMFGAAPNIVRRW